MIWENDINGLHISSSILYVFNAGEQMAGSMYDFDVYWQNF
jgi:hypothetical protein